MKRTGEIYYVAINTYVNSPSEISLKRICHNRGDYSHHANIREVRSVFYLGWF